MSSSTDDRIAVGRIGRPHGLKGEVTVLPDSDDPGRFAAGSTFVTDRQRSLTVRSSQPYRDSGLIVLFEGIANRKRAEELRGSILTIHADQRRELESDEFWPDDLIGLVVIDQHGSTLGTVIAIETAGQDRLLIRQAGGSRFLLPFVEELVDDPVDGVIHVRLPDGLLEDETETD